jgi:hypothetical protein
MQPGFALTAVETKDGRFQLAVRHPMFGQGRDAAPLSALKFRVSSPGGHRLTGPLSFRDLLLPVDGAFTTNLGVVGLKEPTISIVVDDISWISYGRVEAAPAVSLSLSLPSPSAAAPPASAPPNQPIRPILPAPGTSGALEAWIDWALTSGEAGAIGREPTVMVSFAQPDQVWAKRIEQHLDIAMQRRRDGRTERQGSVWSYRDEIRAGDHIHRKVVRAMMEARAAVVLLSPDYHASHYCERFELPFLLWRWTTGDFDLRVVRVSYTPIPAPYLVPGPSGTPVAVDISAVADDSMESPLGEPARKARIAELAASEIDRRFARLSQQIVDRLLR